MSPSFREEMERRFGSDEALGVTFLTPWGDQLTPAQLAALPPDKNLDVESLFPDGLSAVCCTHFAIQILKALPGRVRIFGFANQDNPTARVAREELHPGGHDFAVVDGRYLVDPWPRLVPGAFDKMVFDLQDGAEAQEILDIYGPQSCWTRMAEAEQFATTHRPEIRL